jgi:2'-5' RNA ligase
MDADSAQKLLVVVALIDPLAVGTTLNRRSWPAHVTLASNFVVDVPEPEVARAISEACAGVGPLPARFAGEGLFGPEHDVAVRLVESASILAVHERIADRLEGMRGFDAREPAYWRAGYRPHLTLVPSITLREGERRQLPFIAVAELTGSRATVVSTLSLSGNSL